MRSFKFLGIMLVFSLFAVACSADSADNNSSQASEYENGHLLVDPEWVEENSEDIVLFDVRDDEGYEGGHIPGAIHFDRSKLTDENNPVDGMIIEEDDFQDLLRSHGANDDSTIVIYDDGDSLSASRLFYALELYGHEDPKILNGGYTAWLDDEKELSTEAPEVEEGTFTAEFNSDLIATREDVESMLEDETCTILDARSEDEHDGSDVRTERGGHIPGSTHLEWSDAVHAEGVPTFKSAEELEEQFDAAGVDRDQTIIPYCQTNVRGAHSYFSLRLLGFENVMPYEGSWAEWGNDPDTLID